MKLVPLCWVFHKNATVLLPRHSNCLAIIVNVAGTKKMQALRGDSSQEKSEWFNSSRVCFVVSCRFGYNGGTDRSLSLARHRLQFINKQTIHGKLVHVELIHRDALHTCTLGCATSRPWQLFWFVTPAALSHQSLCAWALSWRDLLTDSRFFCFIIGSIGFILDSPWALEVVQSFLRSLPGALGFVDALPRRRNHRICKAKLNQ